MINAKVSYFLLKENLVDLAYKFIKTPRQKIVNLLSDI